MTKKRLNLFFLTLLLILIFSFIYSGIEYQESVTETMKWQSGKYSLTDNTILIGMGIIVSIIIYLILRTRFATSGDQASKNNLSKNATNK